MSTDYYGTPSFFDHISGANVIITGTVVRLLHTESLVLGDSTRIFGVFEITVDSVLMGNLLSNVLRLRILGEMRSEQTVWIVPLTEGERFLFILTRDNGQSDSEQLFAPYFSGIYTLVDEGYVDLPEESLDDITRKISGLVGTRMSLDGLRRLIEFVQQERKDRYQQMEETIPPEVRDRPYPPVEEKVQEGVQYEPLPGALNWLDNQ